MVAGTICSSKSKLSQNVGMSDFYLDSGSKHYVSLWSGRLAPPCGSASIGMPVYIFLPWGSWKKGHMSALSDPQPSDQDLKEPHSRAI